MVRGNLSRLGKVNVVTDTDLLGQVGQFADLNYSSTEAVLPSLSMNWVYARLTYNNSGGTLAAGTVVKKDTGSTYGPFRGCLGAAGTTDAPAGVVDPWISAAVPVGGIFWLIYEGPCKFLFTTGTTLDEGDLLAAGATGRVIKATVGTTSSHLHCGICLEAVDTAIDDDTLFRGYAQFNF